MRFEPFVLTAFIRFEPFVVTAFMRFERVSRPHPALRPDESGHDEQSFNGRRPRFAESHRRERRNGSSKKYNPKGSQPLAGD